MGLKHLEGPEGQYYHNYYYYHQFLLVEGHFGYGNCRRGRGPRTKKYRYSDPCLLATHDMPQRLDTQLHSCLHESVH